jgi:hypothetical protein
MPLFVSLVQRRWPERSARLRKCDKRRRPDWAFEREAAKRRRNIKKGSARLTGKNQIKGRSWLPMTALRFHIARFTLNEQGSS